MATEKSEIPKGQTLRVFCAGSCSGQTEHEVLALVSTADNDGEVSFWSAYQTLACRGCRTISFRQCSSNSESGHYQVGENEWETDEQIKLYPPRTAETKGISPSDSFHVPDRLLGIYEETRGALRNEMPVLAGIGLRAIVESLCVDKQVAGGNLAKMIDSLASEGYLTKPQAQILHKIRTLGNKAAHEVTPHPTEQLELALNVVEHLIEGVYIVPAKVAKLFPDPKPAAAAVGLPLPVIAAPGPVIAPITPLPPVPSASQP
jgi:hypothetical protein